MVYAIVFAAHLFPFGWLYRSRAYTVMSVFGTLTALFSGIFGGAIVTALVMTICEVVLVVWLMNENIKSIRLKENSKAAPKEVPVNILRAL